MSKLKKDCFAIVIGETGTGKSTFINYVANAVRSDPSLHTLQVIIPNEHHPISTESIVKHSERVLDDPTLSKTAECQFYTFYVPTDRSRLIFIDTPGLNDTNGYLKDNENLEKIFHTIKSLEYISAIILVINGATVRMTSNVSNVLARLRQFFPDSIYRNITVVLTNCQGHNASFDKNSLDLPSTCRFFYMQNSVYCRPLNQIKAQRTIFEKDFDASIKIIHEMIEHLRKLQPQSTKAFADLNDERYRLQAFLHEAYLMILDMEKLENELESLKTVAYIERRSIQNFSQTSQISVLRTTSESCYNTICMQCDRVCHEDCKLDEISSEDKNSIFTCFKIRHDRCIQCHCPKESHYYSSQDLQQVNRSIFQSIMRARQQLKYEQEEHVLTLSRLDSAEAIRSEIPKLLDRQCDRIRQVCTNLKRSCRNINITQELINFIQLLHRGRQQLQSPLATDRLENLVYELQCIISDCQQTGNENNGISSYCNIQNPNSSEALPPAPSHAKSKRQAPVQIPSYYKPNSKPEMRSPSHPIQKSHPQHYSTDELISAHQELTLINSEYAMSTLHELEERAKGSSVGFLNRYELVQFAKHYAAWQHREKNDLQEEYDNLAGRIDADIGRDVSNLHRAKTDHLLKIAVLSSLINP